MSIFKKKEFNTEEIEKQAGIYSPNVLKKPKRPKFERLCNFSEKVLGIKTPEKMQKQFKECIFSTDLNITPNGVFSLTILTFVLLSLLIAPTFFFSGSLKVFALFIPFIGAYFIYTYPKYIADVTKIKASDETIKIILYMVIYLRFNPQLEGAFSFAAEYCHGPIGKDFKELLWGIETGQFINIKQAIGTKMEKWLAWDKEFIESMNLLLSMTRIGYEDLRKKSLDKALSYILTSTYEKMSEYSRNLRTPMTMIHSMGITFPLMGLVMFPMISIFLHDQFNPYVVGLGYIIILPSILYFYLKRTISKRPGAFSFPDISHHPNLPPEGKYELNIFNKKILVPVLLLSLIVLFYVSIPGTIHVFNLASKYFTLKQDPFTFEDNWKAYLSEQYEPGSLFKLSFFSLSIILGISFSLITYLFGMSYQRLKIRDEIKMVEDEFQVGLFNLSDILSSGIPVETALEEVAEKYKQSKMDNSPMYGFFVDLIRNMKNMGMTLENAVFNKKYGAIRRFPSKLINDIMMIIISASKKSSEILSSAARSISEFLSKTKNIESMMKKILEDISSAIQLQAVFIVPFMCAIVATMATFIVEILQKISKILASLEETFNMGGTFVHGGTVKLSDSLGLIQIEKIMPPTLFQLIVGIYMIEVVFILSYFLNGIRNGFDETTRNVLIGKTLLKSTLLYSVLLLISLFLSKTLFPMLGGL